MEISALPASIEAGRIASMVGRLKKLMELQGAMASKLIESARVESPAHNYSGSGEVAGMDIRI